jgi:hypothetical protein
VTQRKGAGGDDREHVFAQDLKVVCSHWQLSRHSGMNQLSLGRTKQRIPASSV